MLSFVAFAHATKIKPTPLSELVAQADYIIVGKVVKVDMVDASGHEIVDERPRHHHTQVKQFDITLSLIRKKL